MKPPPASAARSAPVLVPDHAAATIAAARRVLVTGLVGATAGEARAAADLAERLGAAFDPGSPETSRVLGPTIARIGGVTAVPDELRDRADLVVLWFWNGDRGHAAFLERFVAPPPRAGSRTTLAVGPHDVPVAGTSHHHLAVPATAAVDTARIVEALVAGFAIDGHANGDATSAARDVVEAVARSACVAIVSDWSGDTLGLGPWSTASLVRRLSHGRPAFEVPLGERDDAAIAVAAWRYGAAGAIEVADRAGGRFLPAEGDAVRLIERREADCVIVVGDATPEVTAAIARAGDAIAVVRLATSTDLGSLAAAPAARGASR
jgi:formylmethanofuran dehydrogenase subunit B